MPKFDGLTEFVQSLRRLRRWLAPPGSMRETLVRLIYRPVFNKIPVEQRQRLMRDKEVNPQLVYLRSLGVEKFHHVPIKTIVVLKLDHFGDMIVGMRAMRTLREGFPNAHITLVCASWNEALAKRLDWFDRIVRFDFFTPLNRDWLVSETDLLALYDQVAALPLESYDLAVDFRHDPDTRPCLYRIAARYRAGYYAPPEAELPWLDLVLPISEAIPVGETATSSLHAELRLEVLGSAVVSAFGRRRPHPIEALMPRQASTPARRYAIIAVGAGDPIRCWPIERYGELGNVLIARHGLDIVILAGPSDREDAMKLAAMLPSANVRTVISTPLVELPPLIAAAALCVCNGSGISHFAAALEVPTVCLLGGTTRMEVWHPAGPNVISIGGRTPCQPCGLRLASECPWDVACLTVIETRHVVDACEQLLDVFSAVSFGRAS